MVQTTPSRCRIRTVGHAFERQAAAKLGPRGVLGQPAQRFDAACDRKLAGGALGDPPGRQMRVSERHRHVERAAGGGARPTNDWRPLAGTARAVERASGWFGGVQGGCDYQAGSIVFGVGGRFDWADLKGIALVVPPAATAGLQLSSSLDRFATATGRLGYAFDRVLLYAKGGAAWAHLHHDIGAYDATTNVITPALTAGQNVTGFIVGGGFEFALLRNVSFTAEYNYLDFGTNSVQTNCVPGACGGGGTAGLTFDIRQNVHLFTLGLNYRFGLGDSGPVVARY
jgi:outer membrane immunogenic protein